MRLIVNGPSEIPKCRRPSPALRILKTHLIITPHPSIASMLVTKAAWAPCFALPGSSSCRRFTVRLRKIQKHPDSVTGIFWHVTFWQMLLLATNYSSCLSFLTTHPLCLLSESGSGATLSIFRKPQASFACKPAIRKLACRRRAAVAGGTAAPPARPPKEPQDEETRGDRRGDTPTLTTGP